MRFKERSKNLIASTMQIVADNGFAEFTMKKVTQCAGVSEALLYKYFATKEELLESTFTASCNEVFSIFDDFQLPDTDDKLTVYAVFRGMWDTYFDFLIKNRQTTQFLYEYVNSPYFSASKEYYSKRREDFIEPFKQLALKIGDPFRVKDRFISQYLWMYFTDASFVFARSIIRGELEDSSESRDMIWNLLADGFMGTINN